MRRLKILAVVLVILSLFIACNKDDDKTAETTKSSNSKTTAGDGEDSDAWWKQYTTEASSKSSSKTTAKSSSTTNKSSSTTKKSSTTTKKSSSGSGSADTTKGSSGGTTTASEPYTKVSQNTMTYSNTDGGTTTLSKDPSNKFIKEAISKLSSGRSETFTAEQMMYYTDGNDDFVFVYSSVSSKSNSTLKYVLYFNSDASLHSLIIDSNNNQVLSYAFFPYATSGTASYNSYRSEYVTKATIDYYNEIRNTYSTAENDNNVKVFLSW